MKKIDDSSTLRTFLVAQMVKHLSTMWETWVRSLGPGEGNGNPLQYSCLEKSHEQRTSKLVHGVAKEWDTT